ncbi:MAG TPA: ROK family transcriptional regulator [Bryobacteraceae bacterium]|jgi:predicted NBD/HSP70 family sugar kinase|nr:ROK family transcriptional regulator [Bryobacteraceae bacterium]
MLRIDLSDLPVASSETARHLNRRVILNLIRDKQPISRADLARLSGLQRSTVSLIAEELIEDRWVVEGSTGRLPRGRRPTLLLLNQRRKIICVDIRPKHTYIGVSDVNGLFSFQESIGTARDPERAIRQIISRLRPLLKARTGDPFEGIGISVPGRVDYNTQSLIFAPNLKWPAVDLRTPIERETGLEVALENAANACALAEFWFDRANTMRNFVTVTVSEGIGTGMIVDGRLVRGANGMAGELGHFSLQPDGPQCGCGKNGCWEVLASDQAAIRYYFESAARGSRVRPPDLEFKALLSMADQGDTLAIKALDKMAVQLARGVCMIVAAVDPEAILFVGEFTTAWGRFEPRIKAAVQQQKISTFPVALIPGRDGELTRLRGSVALVLYKHFGVSLPLSVTL